MANHFYTDVCGQRTKWRRNTAEYFNRLSEFTFAKAIFIVHAASACTMFDVQSTVLPAGQWALGS